MGPFLSKPTFFCFTFLPILFYLAWMDLFREDNLMPFLFSRPSKCCAFTPPGFTSDHPRNSHPTWNSSVPRTSNHLSHSSKGSSTPHENLSHPFLISAGKTPLELSVHELKLLSFPIQKILRFFQDCSWISQELLQNSGTFTLQTKGFFPSPHFQQSLINHIKHFPAEFPQLHNPCWNQES